MSMVTVLFSPSTKVCISVLVFPGLSAAQNEFVIVAYCFLPKIRTGVAKYFTKFGADDRSEDSRAVRKHDAPLIVERT